MFGISSVRGGVESVILNYSKELCKKGCSLDYIVIDETPDFLTAQIEKESKIFVVPYVLRNPKEYVRRLKKILLENSYDIVWYHVNTLIDITLLQLAKQYKVPIRIVHAHNSKYMGRKILYPLHFLHKYTLKKVATHYISCSKVAEKFMFLETDLLKKKHCVLKNAINTDLFVYDETVRNKYRTLYGVKDAIVFGNIGRFSLQKNHIFLIDIFYEIYKKYHNVFLVLVGTGELLSKIKSKVYSLRLDKNVLFLNSTNNIKNIYQMLDVFLLPSLYEGLPMVGVEAQAAGLPCYFADTISKEAAFSNDVKFLSLDLSASAWAEYILKDNNNFHRKNKKKIIEEAGFDIKKSVDDFIAFCEDEKIGVKK